MNTSNRDLYLSTAYSILEIDSINNFGVLDLEVNGLTAGWSAPEVGHTWNDGREAIFECGVKGLTGGCVVEFSGTPFLHGGVDHQEIYLYINGFRMGYWRLTESKDYALTVKLEAEQLFRRGEFSTMKCVWFFPGAVKPVDMGINADSRALAFCFRSITISRP
jgi:hypothetical protein